MSTWTHINGSIRFDLLPGMTKKPDLGNTCTFESPESDWDKCDVPIGSEGSMQYDVWQNPDGISLAAMTATFFGDLRDYGIEDHDKIHDYFNRIVKGNMVRQGIFVIECNLLSNVYLFNHDNKSWNFVGQHQEQ